MSTNRYVRIGKPKLLGLNLYALIYHYTLKGYFRDVWVEKNVTVGW